MPLRRWLSRPASAEYALSDIKVGCTIEPALIDIVTEQYDAGVRQGEPACRDMIALRIGPDLRMWSSDARPTSLTTASRSNRRTSRITALQHPPADLRGLYCLGVSERDGRRVTSTSDGPFVLNDMQTAITPPFMRGVGDRMEDMVVPFIAEWTPVRGMEDWSPRSPLHLYYPNRRHPSRRSLLFWRNYGPTLIYKQGE